MRIYDFPGILYQVMTEFLQKCMSFIEMLHERWFQEAGQAQSLEGRVHILHEMNTVLLGRFMELSRSLHELEDAPYREIVSLSDLLNRILFLLKQQYLQEWQNYDNDRGYYECWDERKIAKTIAPLCQVYDVFLQSHSISFHCLARYFGFIDKRDEERQDQVRCFCNKIDPYISLIDRFLMCFPQAQYELRHDVLQIRLPENIQVCVAVHDEQMIVRFLYLEYEFVFPHVSYLKIYIGDLDILSLLQPIDEIPSEKPALDDLL